MGALRSRPLSILLSVLILLTSVFTIIVSASNSEYNVLNPNLTEWTSVGDTVSVVNKDNTIFRLDCKGNSYSVGDGTVEYFGGFICDLPEFVVGHSYTLKFKIPNGATIGYLWNMTYTNDNVIAHYNNSKVIIGYGFLNSDNGSLASVVPLFEFDSSNIANYLGGWVTASFMAENPPEAGGAPCIFIYCYANDDEQHRFFFSDFLLVDNDDDSHKLDGIEGFLHSIRWELTGGVCDNEDCVHSNSDNPHLSLFESLALKIETYLQAVTDEIQGFFTGLGNLLLYFDWDGEYDNPFENENDTVQKLSEELKKVSDYVSGVGDSFESTVDTLTGALDLFSRFTERFNWLVSICVFALALIVVSRFIGL